MAFYYNRSDYSGRLDGGRSRDAPSAGPIPCQDRLSLGLDEETALRNVPTDASQGGQQQQQRRRERYGDALRLAKQGLPRREKRRAKFLGDLGADTTDRARVSRNRSQQGAQPVDPTGYINEVIINSDGRVSYGSWRGLIAYLTSPHLPADNYAKAFFLTFRIFATPTDLSSALVGRGRELLRIYQPPAAEPKGSSDQVQAAPVHRVFRAIKVWYDEYWYPETDDPMLRGLCAFMLHEYLPKCNGAAAKECRSLLQAVASTHSDIDIDAMATAKLQRSTFTFSAGDEAGNGEASTRPPLLRPDKRGTETSRRSSNRRSRDTGDARGRAQASGDGARRLSGGYSMISGDESPVYDLHPNSHSRQRLRQRFRRQSQKYERQSQQHEQSQQRFWKRVFRKFSQSPPGDAASIVDDSSPEDDTPWPPRIEELHEVRGHTPAARSSGRRRTWDGGRANRHSDSDASPDDEPTISDLLMATVGVDLSLSAFRRVSHLYQISPTDVACQLTIIESSCYCQIRPFELINKEFSRGDDSRAINVRQMTRWCTQITHWVAASILLEPTPVRRCRMLKYFIELGIQLLALKNYDAVMAVKAAIYSASVMRLKRTWDILPEKFSLMCRRIHEAMDPDHNYANYRRLLRRSEPPFLPFLGLYLTDLTFIDDGNPTYRRFEEAPPAMPSQPSGQSDFHRLPPLQGSRLSSDGVSQSPQPLSQAATGPVQLVGQTCALFARRQDIDLNSRPILVNFEKAYRIADVITEVQKFQVEYSGNFAMAIPGLQQYLIEQWTLYEAEGYDDDKIYSMSVNSEPRAMQISAGTRHHHHQGPLPPQQQQEQEQQEQPPSSMRLTRLLAGTQRLKHRDSLL